MYLRNKSVILCSLWEPLFWARLSKARASWIKTLHFCTGNVQKSTFFALFCVQKSFVHRFCLVFLLENWHGHNFSRLARIEPSFCTVAKLEELNNFYLDCFESYITKNASFESPGYLARARARARAHGPPPQGAGGPPARFAKVSKYFSLCARAHHFQKFLRARASGALRPM